MSSKRSKSRSKGRRSSVQPPKVATSPRRNGASTASKGPSTPNRKSLKSRSISISSLSPSSSRSDSSSSSRSSSRSVSRSRTPVKRVRLSSKDVKKLTKLMKDRFDGLDNLFKSQEMERRSEYKSISRRITDQCKIINDLSKSVERLMEENRSLKDKLTSFLSSNVMQGGNGNSNSLIESARSVVSRRPSLSGVGSGTGMPVSSPPSPSSSKTFRPTTATIPSVLIPSSGPVKVFSLPSKSEEEEKKKDMEDYISRKVQELLSKQQKEKEEEENKAKIQTNAEKEKEKEKEKNQEQLSSSLEKENEEVDEKKVEESDSNKSEPILEEREPPAPALVTKQTPAAPKSLGPMPPRKLGGAESTFNFPTQGGMSMPVSRSIPLTLPKSITFRRPDDVRTETVVSGESSNSQLHSKKYAQSGILGIKLFGMDDE